MIILKFLDLRFLIAQGTGRVLLNRKESEFHFQRIIDQELPDQRFSFLQNEFDCLCGLNQTNLPGYNSQDTCFVSAGDKTGWRRLWKKAPQTGASITGRKNARLSFKLKYPAKNKRFLCKEGRIID